MSPSREDYSIARIEITPLEDAYAVMCDGLHVALCPDRETAEKVRDDDIRRRISERSRS